MKIVIGLTGEKGGGKGTFVKLLSGMAVGQSVSCQRSGDVLVEILRILGIETNRAKLQKLAIIVDATFGQGTLTNAVRQRIIRDGADVIIFDGVRWPTDVAMVRSFPRNALVYVTANVQTRYERTKTRREKAGEAVASFEEFFREELAATETAIPRIGASADCQIVNDGSEAELQAMVKMFYESYLA